MKIDRETVDKVVSLSELIVGEVYVDTNEDGDYDRDYYLYTDEGSLIALGSGNQYTDSGLDWAKDTSFREVNARLVVVGAVE